MATLSLLNDYMTPLLAGNRMVCRQFVQDRMKRWGDTMRLYRDLLWPAMEQIETMYREDKINAASEHMATRINRAIADQMQAQLDMAESSGKKIIICCAEGECEELGAQITADIFESRGWEVYFLGGGVPADEILTLVGQMRPEILMIYGTNPSGVPMVRNLIDTIRAVDATPTMNVMVSGGVFNRADGLWKEVHADLFANTAYEAIPIAEAAEPRKAEPRPLGAPKKRRRRRRPPLLTSPGQG